MLSETKADNYSAVYLPLQGLAKTYYDNEEYNKAIECGEKAYSIAKESKRIFDTDIIMILDDLTEYYTKKEEYTTAIELQAQNATKLNETMTEVGNYLVKAADTYQRVSEENAGRIDV